MKWWLKCPATRGPIGSHDVIPCGLLLDRVTTFFKLARNTGTPYGESCASSFRLTPQGSSSAMMNSDMNALDVENQIELEEKTRLINQVLELQHTLEDLSARVDAVKEENLKLKSENQVLGQYIENLMSASSVFQTTDTKGKRK
ncbi:short coiled-coil protein isoform X1 [Ascaphus truei]|uniref:short coiled-coil protein isoform X1 n=2 Tax=Ascaphus truei TaxID=8439 RepID=UPI003F59FBD6